MRQIIMKNFWLKASALLLAALAWLYVVGELDKGTPQETEFFKRILPYRVSAKEVPVKINLIGKPVPGYRIVNEKISVTPSTCVIIAPKSVLENISDITTEEIDIGEYTKSIYKEIKIRPLRTGVVLDKDFFIKVVIPIEKVPQETEPGA